MRTRFPDQYTGPKLSVTFKKGKRKTGLAAVGAHDPPTDIKINKRIVGHIEFPNRHTESKIIKVHLTVKKQQPDSNPNCDWKWIALKAGFHTEQEARTFVKREILTIAKNNLLHVLK